jgi:hypothetical protein
MLYYQYVSLDVEGRQRVGMDDEAQGQVATRKGRSLDCRHV